MNIGLVDVDGHSGFPNLALMRISAWHKAQGDHVEWWDGLKTYDRVYLSKVFTFSPDMETVIQADEVSHTGTMTAGSPRESSGVLRGGSTPNRHFIRADGRISDEQTGHK